ncbi:MAG: hypothetical protein H6Q26_2962, partial [Bacteroidetes bacterium]|nr:hypothetical protein [Bacteroidota bacterium]
MKKYFILAAICFGHHAFAQYPTIPKAVQQVSDSMLDGAKKHADDMWQKALPIVTQEARNGKPYIPYASRPTDLPQASIPAFPGAEG